MRLLLDLRELSGDYAYDETLLPHAYDLKRLIEPEHLRDGTREVTLGNVLAEGGMGVVRLGKQTALHREVAVKTLRDEFLDPQYVRRLLREARVTGLVEHPNIVPVYSLELDQRETPMMVMKRIEGVPWRTLIRNSSHPAFPKDADDPLSWHLQVLMEVCDALHYAHNRGILHLDIKPDNVMIGSFREVYVVDWGVACSMRPDHRGILPMVDEIHEVVGTPAYMAPEMIVAKNRQLGVFTDVYLLGASLFEILEGRPPHMGKSVQDTLYAAYKAEAPTFTREISSELNEIVAKAMAPNAADRYQSVEDFRAAIAAFIRHRGSQKLSSKANRVLDQLRNDIEALESIDPISFEAESKNRRIQRLFGQCRFGFAQALSDWPQNQQARTGIVEAMSTMARYYVARGDAASAEALLGDIEDVEGELIESLDPLREQVKRLKDEMARMAQLSRDQDLFIGSKIRSRYTVLSIVVANIPIALGWFLQRQGKYQYESWHSIPFIFLGLAVFIAGALFWKSALMPNRVARHMVICVMTLVGLMFVQRVVTTQLGITSVASIAPDLLLFGTGCAMLGILIDRHLLWAAFSFSLAAVLCVFFPHFGILWFTFASVLGPGAMAYQWYAKAKQFESMA